MSGFNWLDIIVFALILLFGLKGLKSGIVREFFGILGLIGGIYFAFKFKNEAGIWVSQNVYNLNKINVIGGSGTEAIVGFLALLFGIWIVCLILGEILAKLFSLSGLSFIDKIGGFLFSSAKVFLIFSIFAILVKSTAFTNKQTKPYVQNSIVFPYLVKFGREIIQIDPTKIIEKVQINDENKTEENSQDLTVELNKLDLNSDLNSTHNTNLGVEDGN